MVPNCQRRKHEQLHTFQSPNVKLINSIDSSVTNVPQPKWARSVSGSAKPIPANENTGHGARPRQREMGGALFLSETWQVTTKSVRSPSSLESESEIKIQHRRRFPRTPATPPEVATGLRPRPLSPSTAHVPRPCGLEQIHFGRKRRGASVGTGAGPV